MPRRKIANWMTIQEICQNRYAEQTTEEVEVRAMALARLHAEEEVCAFEQWRRQDCLNLQVEGGRLEQN
jgi:hypothetical protein